MGSAGIFLRTLFWQPYRALAALYWFVTGRRVRARNRLRLAAVNSPHAYDLWIKLHERSGTAAPADPSVPAVPRFSILLWLDPTASEVSAAASLRSVTQQSSPEWESIVIPAPGVSTAPFDPDTRQLKIAAEPAATWGEALGIGLALAEGSYVIPLHAGDQLSHMAVAALAEASDGQPTILYGDEDVLAQGGRRVSPWFKPAWNAEMFLAQDYLSGACALRTCAARAAVAQAAGHDSLAIYALILAMLRKGATVTHVPHILCHRDGPLFAGTPTERAELVAEHVAAEGGEASAGEFGTVKVTWPLPKLLPLVSIIVPTKDKIKLLRACIETVRARTSYPNWELIIVDNGSTEATTHSYMKAITRDDSRIRVLPYDAPYNYSAINNYAVARATGEYLCLLNNDTETLHESWLTEMMRHAVRPHVGAVGAKLLYEDGSIQHAGVVVGLGEAAGHAHRFLRPGMPGYFNQPHLAQYMSAVTAACLVVEKRKFEAVGGLDAENLAIAFNDVDLCLKLEAAGWRNVYTPHATLIHHESKSRGKDISAPHIARYMEELRVLQDRWSTKTYVDPLHHPSLDRASETYVINL